MTVFNPKDIHHNPYYIITDLWIYHNDLCTLSFDNYQLMQKIHDRKPTPPRPTKNNKESSYLKGNIYEKIRKRREELGEVEYKK